MKTTVRFLTHYSELDNGKGYLDLPAVFEGKIQAAHDFCVGKRFEWRRDFSIFGGYYSNKAGENLFLT